MTQVAYPTSDVTNSGFATSSGSGSLASHVDALNDGLWITESGDGSYCILACPVASPSAGNVSVEVRARYAPRTLLAYLYEGATLRSGPHDVTPSGSAFETNGWTLSTAERSAIGVWGDLRVQVESSGGVGVDLYVDVSAVRILAPDPGFPHLDIDPSGPGLLLKAAGSGYYLVVDGIGLRRVSGVETTGALILDAGGRPVVSS